MPQHDPHDPHDPNQLPSHLPGHQIPLSQPSITKLEEDMVLEVMRSGRLSIGPMQERFEQLVAQRCGTTHAIACSSGTSGLHMVLIALGIGPGDEVITTPFSFIASSNAILYVGATPVFVDICPTSLNANPKLIEDAITPRTKAILAVEAFGNPLHMDEYVKIAAKHEIPLIEDSCEALGTVYRGQRAGAFGRAGVFGFYPNKQITTGEGGMIVTNDDHLADACRSLRNQGRAIAGKGAVEGGSTAGSWLHHNRLGFNYRMSEINAAIGVAQMRRLDRIIEGLRMHEIGAGDYFPCIHLQPIYQRGFHIPEGSFPIAESVSQRTLALPFFAGITRQEVDMVAQTLQLMISRENLSRRI